MNGHLTMDEGLIVAAVPDDGFMDAATRRNEMLGAVDIELSKAANVYIGPHPDRPRARTLSLDIKPAKMRELGLLLLEKTGAPAFNEREWREIAQALREHGEDAEADRPIRDLSSLDYAKRIEEAYP